MEIYLVDLKEVDYDEYEGFVISAPSKEEAIAYLKGKYPIGYAQWDKGYSIKRIGENKLEIIKVYLASFNAG